MSRGSSWEIDHLEQHQYESCQPNQEKKNYYSLFISFRIFIPPTTRDRRTLYTVKSTEPTARGSAPSTPSSRLPLEPPGGVLVWLVVVIELITFAAGIGVFLYQEGNFTEEFALGAKGLNQPLAFINTLLLLTGGWFMAMAIAAIREGRISAGERGMDAAMVTGLAFLVLKGIEWNGKIQHGATFGDDHFHTTYFALTGFHFLHVLAGIAILLYLRLALKRGRYSTEDHFDIESGGIFWHMCDLIWLLLYPAIYLL